MLPSARAAIGEECSVVKSTHACTIRDGSSLPCPLKWLDSFSMRNFTNASVFDGTLPAADGRMEIGSVVPIEPLKVAMEDWF
jgi:hypothetical protein